MLSEKKTLEQRKEGSEGMSHVNLREGKKSFPGVEGANIKTLRGEYVLSVQGTARRSVCLGGMNEGESAGQGG